MDAVLGFAHPEQLAVTGASGLGTGDSALGAPHSRTPSLESRVSSPDVARLVLDRLTRSFDGTHAAVDAVSLQVAAGELVALVGASGSGKTTTLRMVAGYEHPDDGRVVLDGRDITALPPQRRDFGMVFQHYALFPHLTVGQNVAFGLEARGVPKRDRLARAAAALANVGLAGAVPRQVQSLSGGEQQRVALARALIIEPPVLLLDEPLSNLDPTLRRSTREDLRATLHRLGVTALFVTHDQEDAFAVADRVALLKEGKLLQVGTSEQLYDQPASRDVAEFIGRATLVPGELDGRRVTVRIGDVTRTLGALPAPGTPDVGRVMAVLRPDGLALADPATPNVWPGIVTDRRFAGALLAYRVRVSDDVEFELHSTVRGVREGDRVSVTVTREPVAVVL